MSIEQNTPLAGTEALTLPPALSKPRLRRNEASQYLEVMHGIPLAPSTLATMAKRASDRIYDAKRPSARQRGYDKEWELAARRFLSQPENRRCVVCGEQATVVDHKIAFKGHNALRMDPANWQPMCRPCNSRKNVRKEGGFGRHPRAGQ